MYEKKLAASPVNKSSGQFTFGFYYPTEPSVSFLCLSNMAPPSLLIISSMITGGGKIVPGSLHQIMSLGNIKMFLVVIKFFN